jgi:hypothetical protein
MNSDGPASSEQKSEIYFRGARQLEDLMSGSVPVDVPGRPKWWVSALYCINIFEYGRAIFRFAYRIYGQHYVEVEQWPSIWDAFWFDFEIFRTGYCAPSAKSTGTDIG